METLSTSIHIGPTSSGTSRMDPESDESCIKMDMPALLRMVFDVVHPVASGWLVSRVREGFGCVGWA